MQVISDWVSEQIDSYLSPPTPDEELRRARVRVRRRLDNISEKIRIEEKNETVLFGKLTKLGQCGDKQGMQQVARGVVRSREAVQKLRGVHSSLSSMQTHLDEVDSATVVREVLRVAADALVAVGGGVAEGVNEEARTLFMQLEMLKEMEARASDALVSGDEEASAEDMMAKVIEEANIAVVSNLPSAPGGGGFGGTAQRIERSVAVEGVAP